MTRVACVLSSLCLIAISASAALPEVIRTDAGRVSGMVGRDSRIRVFKGIPFGASAAGQNRWKAPQPVAKWDGVLKADQFGPTCAASGGNAQGKGGKGKGPPNQKAQGSAKGPGPAPNNAKGPSPVASSEDCLYLNVWTGAMAANERRPVIVWNYGGGFTQGASSQPGYDGEALAKKGAIIVSYNYRLGMFGFFAHPELTKESPHHASGNYALMDLAATLRWVHKNIAAFGGDPNRVTIDGESAGAMLVAAMVGSPQGKGLFQRAIAQSGGWMGLSMGKMRTRAAAEEAGAKAAGSYTIAQLRTMSTQELSQNLRGVPTGMIVDGWMIPEDQSKTFAEGKQNRVDVLLGSNQDEGTFFNNPPITAEQAKAQAQQRYGDLAADFLKLYPSDTNDHATASALLRFRDEVGWHQRLWAQLQVKAGKKAYLYYFTRVTPGREARGATHTAELPYMFHNPPANDAWATADHQLSDQMSSYWVNFASTGNPNGRDLPEWQAYDASENDAMAMVFGNTTQFGPQIDAAKLRFFDQVYARLK